MAQYSSKEMKLWGKWSLHREKGGKGGKMRERKSFCIKESDIIRERRREIEREKFTCVEFFS